MTTYHIERDTSVYTKTHATPEAAIAALVGGGDFERIGDRKVKYRGQTYDIVIAEHLPLGVDRKEWVREQQASAAKAARKPARRGSKIFPGVYGYEEGEV